MITRGSSADFDTKR
jgi:hypothetical protein